MATRRVLMTLSWSDVFPTCGAVSESNERPGSRSSSPAALKGCATVLKPVWNLGTLEL